MPSPPSPRKRKPRACLALLAIGALVLMGIVTPESKAQILERRPSAQQLPQRDTAAEEVELGDLPDTIRIYRYDPLQPNRYTPLPDSALSLDYVRHDPVQAYGPDFVYLNSLAQPAVLNPVLGTPYTRYRPLTQLEHPAYRDRPLPFYAQNIPFSYTAYNQGTEINDGQVRALFGRSFTGGWRVGVAYNRTYQGGERTRYPRSRAQRISFGLTLSRVADSSHHRSYLSVDLNNRSWDSPGGYDFALDPGIVIPDQAFTAVPLLFSARTESRNSSYAYLHRYFLRSQLDSVARGWAGRARVEYRRGYFRSSVVGANSGFTAADSLVLDPFLVDSRGIRFALTEESLLGGAALEYFSEPGTSRGLAFDFSLGAYAGSQRYDAEYLVDGRDAELVGLTGTLSGRVLRDFRLVADADLPLGTRVGEGRLTGELSWTFRQQLELSLRALFERSSAPWSAGITGANQRIVFDNDLDVTTHSRVGGAATYSPLNLSAGGYLDVYDRAVVYGAYGQASNVDQAIAIPTLTFDVPLSLGPLRIRNRGTLRSPTSGERVRYPGYVGQHSVYASLWPFARAMNVIVGADAIVRSPHERYGYFPFTGVFTLDAPRTMTDWTHQIDLFAAFKVQSFKAFIKLENLVVSDPEVGPQTVVGYPLVRGTSIVGDLRPIIRFGVAFFLFN